MMIRCILRVWGAPVWIIPVWIIWVLHHTREVYMMNTRIPHRRETVRLTRPGISPVGTAGVSSWILLKKECIIKKSVLLKECIIHSLSMIKRWDFLQTSAQSARVDDFINADISPLIPWDSCSTGVIPLLLGIILCILLYDSIIQLKYSRTQVLDQVLLILLRELGARRLVARLVGVYDHIN